jgi:tripartite-type tricarboxylate transporter receptor subunit TctC
MRPAAAALLTFLAAAPAAAFPDRPMTIVLPYSPGSAADAYARALGEHMARVLGQSVVVTNRDGGSGVVGMRSVAASPADGHTLGLTPMTAIVVQPHLVRNLGIGPDSFAPVCGTNENVIGVVVRADSPVRDLPALVALGRERQLSFGSAGPNSLPQLAVWRVQRAAGNVDFTHVPYRGDPPHLNELLGGPPRLLLHRGRLRQRADRLRALAADRRVLAGRHPDYPDVPTAREQGLTPSSSAKSASTRPAARRSRCSTGWRRRAAPGWKTRPSAASPRAAASW